MPETLEILERLIAFPTVSRQSNRELIGYVSGLLDEAGIPWEVVAHEDGTRANLFATVGPRDRGGVVLSGHTDVVPVEGQDWATDPLRLHHADGRYYGRGTADMKGFVAAAVACALRAARTDLQTPLHLALSYDEEIGCVGVRGLIERLKGRSPRPALCIVGEPTGLRIATGHKGKTGLVACCTGHASHSALAPEGLNALYLASDFLGCLRHRQDRIVQDGARDPSFSVPYTTLHAGVMSGGRALNIVPDHCEIRFEIRNIAADDPQAIVDGLRADARAIVRPHADRFPKAAIDIERFNAYPGLDTPADAQIVALLREITQQDAAPGKVDFGTEGGLFDAELGIPTAICGPGHMAQGHKPDEYVSGDQLAQCDAMLERLVGRLAQGL